MLVSVKNKTMKKILFVALMLPLSAFSAHQHHVVPQAPIGIMGYHLHPEGEWMMSYSYMQMKMDGNLQGRDSVDAPLPGYMVSPLAMDMKMHMLGVMYGYSNSLTMMAMIPVKSYSMDLMLNMNSKEFSTESSGVGDLKLSAIFQTGMHWVSSVGLNLPTGSIDEKDINPQSSGNAVQLPYPMQMGSGSYELSMNSTYIKK